MNLFESRFSTDRFWGSKRKSCPKKKVLDKKVCGGYGRKMF